MLPGFLDKLRERPAIHQIAKNIGWLSFDKFFRLAVSFIVGILVARYLGPTDFGFMSFAFALSALCFPIVGFGMKQIVSRELIKKKTSPNELLGTFAGVYIVTAIIAALAMVLIFLLFGSGRLEDLLIVGIVALGIFAQSFDIFGTWFDSRLESKRNVTAGSIALVISNAFKLIFIFLGLPLIFIVIASLFDAIVSFAVLFYFYQSEKRSILKWKASFSLAKKLAKQSWPLVLSGFLIVVYLKIDQFLIGIMLGNAEVGLYTVSVKLTEFFYFLPAILTVSLFPSLVNTHVSSKDKYYGRLQGLFYFMTWAPFAIIIPIFFLAYPIISILYGAAYAPAAGALAISIWALLSIFIKAGVDIHLVNVGKTGVAFVCAFIGAASNIALNLLWIPEYGIYGAALATVVSYTLAAYLGVALFPSTRKVFWILLKSFNIVKAWKYSLEVLKKIM